MYPKFLEIGILWNPNKDAITYRIFKFFVTISTKKSVLSEKSQMFDPLGILGPFIVVVKRFLQLLWKEKLDCNNSLPNELLIILDEFL